MDDLNKDGSKKSKAPSNIFLINKELNPMFGVPRAKHVDVEKAEIPAEGTAVKKIAASLNEEAMNVVEGDMKDKPKDKKNRGKRSVRSTGLLKGGFNFVKDAMKGKKGK